MLSCCLLLQIGPANGKMEAKDASPTVEEECTQTYNPEEGPDSQSLKQHMLLEQQQKDIQVFCYYIELMV